MSTTTYDDVPYMGAMQTAAHPDRLAALARLHGLVTPAVETCRVLELGCGDGSNIIPEAVGLPGAQFVGIDLSAAAIARGKAAVAALGLKGVDLRVMNLMDVPEDFGAFDFIIAHGVYSWVPDAVRDRIMETCRRHLSANGIAYISYNVLPGCRLRQVSWDLMRFHGGGSDAAEQVSRAREILKLAAEYVPEGAYGTVLKAEAERVAALHDGHMFHDDLMAGGTPMFFHEFAARAAAGGLQYVCDARYRQDADEKVQPRATEFLKKVGETDLIRREQYADFVVGRAFRRSLLCRAEAALSRPVMPERLRGLRIASALQAVGGGGGNPAREGIREFRQPAGKSISIGMPLAKAALMCLGEAWPQSVAFEELLEQARQKSEGKGSQEEEGLGRILLTLLAAELVEVHSVAAPLVTSVSAKPHASALARWQVRQGPLVMTLTGTTLRMDDAAAAKLLARLDGTRDIRTLCREFGVEKETMMRKLRELAKAGIMEA